MWKIFKKERKDVVVMVVSVVIVLVVLNFLSSRHFFRGDLTEGGQYTLSESTKKILKDLDDVVNVKVYFSRELPPMLMALKRDLSDILSEYSTYAGNKLNVQYIDPTETPQREQQVQLIGIPPVQVNVIEKDKHEVAKLYLGMAISYTDKTEVIPVIQKVGNLEYELTSAILKVTTLKRPSLVWFSDYEDNHFAQAQSVLGERYEVRGAKAQGLEIDPTKEPLLIITVKGEVPEETLAVIDEYMKKGGKVITLVDMIEIKANLQAEPVESNIVEWLKKHGVEVEPKLVVDRINAHAAFSGGYVTYHVPYPFWVKVIREEFDLASPIVADLDILVLPWASPLSGDGQVLAASSSEAVSVGLGVPLLPDEAGRYLFAKDKGPQKLVLFKDEGLLVAGNSRFISDNFLRQFSSNLIFFENAVDYLGMGSELIGIRSKSAASRPIKEMSQGAATAIKYLNILGSSVLLVVFGLAVMFIRKEKKKRIEIIYR